MYDARRRNDLDIQADILRFTTQRGGALKTHIVYGSNLNFDIVKKYLARLIRRGLLVAEGPRYFPTEKGVDYLAAYEALSALLRRHPPLFCLI